MRKRKIRGHKKRWRHIQNWIDYNKELDLEYLKEYGRDYIKIRVSPWGNLSLRNSQYPNPKGKTKLKIIKGLIEIYNSWKKQLDSLGETYYLKIWLFEPRFSYSQVVCALGDYSNYYNNTFHKPDFPKKLQEHSYGKFAEEIEKFDWDFNFDEDHFDNNEIGEPEDFVSQKVFEENKRRFNKMMKKPHRTTKYSKPIGEAKEFYSLKKGIVWIGQLKNK